MNKINDDLLVKILSFLPTKVAVTTSILSKRWEFIWMQVPKLEYDDSDTTRRRRLRSFINRKLPLHRVPVLESLRLKFSTLPFQPEDIEQWVEVALSLCVRELSIDYCFSLNKPVTLPDCLYTSKSLESLKLDQAVFVIIPHMVCLPSLKNLQLGGVRYYLDEDVQLLDVSHTVCFPSLKSLHLKEVIFFDKKSLRLLLANCPDLEELVVELEEDDCMGLGDVPIILPSLKSLSIFIPCSDYISPYVVEIVAPSLKYIKLDDHCNNSFLIDNMPNLEEAYAVAKIFAYAKFLGSFTFVKRLSLCLNLQPTEAGNVDAIFFSQLESLKICVCKPYWPVLLVRLLKGSPKLKYLELYSHTVIPLVLKSPLICWDQVTPVPECLLTRLEIFKWTDLPRTKEARDMIAYITKNSRRLKSEPFPGTWSLGPMAHVNVRLC